MSIDYSASFGYGLEITNKKLLELDNYDIFIGKDFEVGFGGDSYADEGSKTFLFIKKSSFSVYTWGGGVKRIKQEKLVAQPDWDDKLRAWAKEYKVNKPKLGWYLLASVS